MEVGFTGSQRKCLYFVSLQGSFMIWCTAEDKIPVYFHAVSQRTLLLLLLRNNGEKENYVTSVIPGIYICNWPQIHLTETYFACKCNSTKTLDGDCTYHFYTIATYGWISSVIN